MNKAPGEMNGTTKIAQHPQKARKYYTIQVLRFIAAFMVLVLHSTFYTNKKLDNSTYIFEQGTHGVDLFFTISGFVIFTSSTALVNKTNGWRIFALKRLVRIVPVYWIINTCKLLVLLCAPSVMSNKKIDFLFILKSYFFIPARNADGSISPFYAIGWTLNFEMFFYVLFAITMASRIKPILFFTIVFVPLTIAAAFTQNNWPSIQFYAHPLVLNFLYGIIIANLVIKGKILPRIVAIIAIIAGLALLFVPGFMPAGNMEKLPYSFTYLPYGLCCFMVIYGAASIEHLWGNKLPQNLIYLGGASYAIYLIHPLVAAASPDVFNMLHITQPLLCVIVSGVGALIVSVLFYKFCEEPVTKYVSSTVKKAVLPPAGAL